MNLRQATHLPGPNSSMGRRSTIRFNPDIIIGSLGEFESLALGGQQEEEVENKRESEDLSDTPSLQVGEAHRDTKASCPLTISDKDLLASSDAEDAIITEEARTF
ncbi:hypothetical protein BC629DRAFT_1599221 [Irpex lacteus]|nr:hypothetical protein BC629DRAFT_1599221 [Irpex lacteus]